LGIDQEQCDKALEGAQEFLNKIATLAAERKVYIATGVAIYEGEKLYNAAYIYDDDGRLLHKTAKSNMWHYDATWFTPGEEYEVFDTKFGKMGMLICADGRVPEIARILALKGARLIIDTVNLTAAAADPKALMNQQYEFMLPVRAMENNTWFLVSDKAGLEAKTGSYLGRSMVIAPNGDIVADASTDKQEIVYYEVDMELAGGEQPERRPELYGELVKDVNELDVCKVMKEPVMELARTEVFVSTAAFKAQTEEAYLEQAKFYVRACELMKTKILCLPQMNGDSDIEALVSPIQSALTTDMIVVVSGMSQGCKSAVIFDKEGIYSKCYKTHGELSNLNGQLEVVKTPYGRLSVMFDEEAYIQEIARVHMLKGCEILIWSDSKARGMDTKVMQTRGAENKIFVVRTSNAENDTSSAANPDGKIFTSTFRGMEQAASGLVFLLAARAKTVVPGTNIVLTRIARAYKDLL
jgi:predicted amidohydrolase